MKNTTILISFLLLFLSSCDDSIVVRDFPLLRTLNAVDINSSGVTFEAEILYEGKTPVSSYGFVWSTDQPTLSTSHKQVVTSTLTKGIFKARIENSFYKGTTYKVKAFAIYGNDTIYGNMVEATSKGCKNSVWTQILSDELLVITDDPVGYSNGTNGFVLFPNGITFRYDSLANKFLSMGQFPLYESEKTRYSPVSNGNNLYVFTNQGEYISKLENNKWIFFASTPFKYSDCPDFQYSFFKSDCLLLISSYKSYAYNLSNKSWKSLSSLPKEFGSALIGGTHLNGNAILMTSDKSICEYNPDKDVWKKLTTFPGVLHDRIVSFAIGHTFYFGLSSSKNSKDVQVDTKLWSYDTTTDQWAQTDDIPLTSGKGNVFSFSLNNKLYVGYCPSTSARYTVYKFNPALN